MQKLQADRTFLFKEKEFWLLIGLTVAYFYRPLFAGQTFFFRDLYLFYYPQHHRLVELLHSGQWPLWDPNLHGGQPFLGHVLNLVLYPTTALYLFLPTITAFNIEIVLHILFCGVGAYVLARALKLSPASAFLAGVSYAFCGYTLSCVNLFVRLIALPYIPLLLWSWHRFLIEQTRRWFLLSLGFLVAFILSGAVETDLMGFLLLFGWTLLFPYNTGCFTRIASLLVLFLFGFGITAIQIFPTAETIAQSTRDAGYRYSVFAAWPLNIRRVPEMILPGFFGRTDGIKASDYWGIAIEGSFPYMLSIYFGMVLLFLSIRAPFIQRARVHIPGRLAIFLFSMIAISFLLSLGDALPFFEWLYRHVPGINRFRYPLKLLTLSLLPISLLAAATFEADFVEERRPALRLIAFIWIIAAGLAGFTLTFIFLHGFQDRFLNFYFHTATTQARNGVSYSLMHAGLIWLAAALLYQTRYKATRAWQSRAFAAILAMDLLWAGSPVNHFAPRQFLTETPQLAKIVKEQIDGARFLRMPDPNHFVFRMPADDINFLHRWNIETLKNYTAAGYGIPVIYHENFDGVAKKEIANLADIVRAPGWQNRLPLLLASGIRIVLSPDSVQAAGLRFLGVVNNSSSADFMLYQVVDAARNVFATTIHRAGSDEEALRLLMKPGFNPLREVIIQQPEGDAGSGCMQNAPVHVSYLSTADAQYSVEANCSGYLVFAEPFYPGWQVSVDGKPAQLVKANYAFSAVLLSPGKHVIERAYRPRSILYGGVVSAITILILLVLMTVFRRYPHFG